MDREKTWMSPFELGDEVEGLGQDLHRSSV